MYFNKMLKHKIKRSSEKEENFQQQRRKRKAQNQYNHQQNAKKTFNENNIVVNQISDTFSVAGTSFVNHVVQVSQCVTSAEY